MIDKIIYLNRIKPLTLKSGGTQVSKAIEDLKTKGYTILNDLMTPNQLQYFQSQIESRLQKGNVEYPCLAQAKIDPDKHSRFINNHLLGTKEELQINGLTFCKSDFTTLEETQKRFRPSTLTIKAFQEDQQFFNLWLNETILEIITKYMGLTPFLTEAYIRRNYPAKYKSMNHFWHRDLNHKSYLIKAFFFFTDCNLESGPHEYVTGSHINKNLSGKIYYTDKEVSKSYSDEQRVKSIVKAGTIILEDTRGLHRAIVPKKGYRDLGYGVFLPIPFYKKSTHPCYLINQDVLKSLKKEQQLFIPKKSIK